MATNLETIRDELRRLTKNYLSHLEDDQKKLSANQSADKEELDKKIKAITQLLHLIHGKRHVTVKEQLHDFYNAYKGIKAENATATSMRPFFEKRRDRASVSSRFWKMVDAILVKLHFSKSTMGITGVEVSDNIERQLNKTRLDELAPTPAEIELKQEKLAALETHDDVSKKLDDKIAELTSSVDQVELDYHQLANEYKALERDRRRYDDLSQNATKYSHEEPATADGREPTYKCWLCGKVFCTDHGPMLDSPTQIKKIYVADDVARMKAKAQYEETMDKLSAKFDFKQPEMPEKLMIQNELINARKTLEILADHIRDASNNNELQPAIKRYQDHITDVVLVKLNECDHKKRPGLK